jgi:phage-related protein
LADGSIILDTRINNKGAYAELKELQAKAKSTAQQVAALDKQLAQAGAKHTSLGDDLKRARQETAETARELQKLNTTMDLQHQKNGLDFSPADVKRSDKLRATLDQQQQKIGAMSKEYRDQVPMLEKLQEEHDALLQQMDTENLAVEHQSRRIESLLGRQIAASRAVQGVKNAVRLSAAAIQQPFKAIQARLSAMTKGMGRFSRRIAGLASSALIFNLLSSGLRQMTSYMGTALLSSASLRQTLGNLQGAAATAAAPLIQVLTPALTALANAAATVFAYLAKLVAFLTGKTVSSAKAAAKGMSGTSKAAKEAAQSLAGFDEIERLDKKDSSSGGSGASSITPNYNFDAKSPFLDSVLAAIEAGEWNQVGQLFAQKLNEAMAAIPWPDIQDKAQTWAANIADTLNGFIARLDWRLVGSTLAQGLNTALIFADTLVQSIHWDTLGNGIGNGMNQCVEELDWEALGRLMIAKWKILFETLHGFIQTFDFGALGDAFARATMAAINNIDWPQAAADLVSGAAGLLEALAHWIDGLDWQQIGSTIAECITNIDYAELAQAILDLLSAAVTGLADGLSALAGQLVGDFIQGVKQWFDDVQTQAAVAGYGDNVARYLFDGFINGLEALWNGIGQWIYDHIFTPFKNGICEAFGIHSPSTEAKSWGSYISQGLLDGLASKWENITGWLRDLKQNFVDAWDNIRAKTTETFNSLGQTISDIWNGISSTIKNAVNGIIGFINRMISAVVTGINAVINALNGLSFDLPDIFGGGHVGFNISTLTAPQIPYLAQGAVIPANREFLAVLGDQSHGTNVEAPLDTIKQAVAEVMEDLQAGQMAGFEAVVSVLREILSAVYGIELTDEDVGRAVQRWQRKQLIATGGV